MDKKILKNEDIVLAMKQLSVSTQPLQGLTWWRRRTVYFFLLSVMMSLFVGFSCKKSSASEPNSNAVEWGDNSFHFFLYDGLTQQAAIPIRESLMANATRIQDDLEVQAVTTYNVHLWADNDSYLDAQERYLGQRYPGSSGYVMGANGMGLLNSAAASTNAVHEYAHSMSLLIQPRFGNNPRWLWEAVALYENEDFVHPNRISYLSSGNYPNLSELNSDFGSGSRKIYQVGYLLIEFILYQWGKGTMIELIRQTGDIPTVLHISVAEFETQWKTYVERKYFGR